MWEAIRRCHGVSRTRLPGNHGIVGGAQLRRDRSRATARRRTQMSFAQLFHEGAPHLRTTILQQLRPDAELLGHRQVLASPDRHLRQHRQQLDALLGQTVDRLLQMRRVVGLGDDPLREQHPKPIGEDIGGNALLRSQQFAVVPFVAEHHIANDQEAPLVAHHLKREVDRASGLVVVAHPSLRDENRLHYCIALHSIQSVAKCNHPQGSPPLVLSWRRQQWPSVQRRQAKRVRRSTE